MIGGLFLSLALATSGVQAQATPVPAAVVATIQVHGNVATPDAEVIRLAGLSVGQPFDTTTVARAEANLVASHAFEQVQVLKRLASIDDERQVAIVIIAHEGPVNVDWPGEGGALTKMVTKRRLNLMFLPVVDYEDGYGVTYGARLAVPSIGRTTTRLSMPVTWGGDKRLGATLAHDFSSGPLNLLSVGAAWSRRTNPFNDVDDSRLGVSARAERALGRVVRAGAGAGLARIDFDGTTSRVSRVGADLAFDTRLDPVLPRNAIYARASVEHVDFEEGSATFVDLEARGALGLIGQSVIEARVRRQGSGSTLPLFLKPLVGGQDSVRGFRAGALAGDTAVTTSAELRVPLTSPISLGRLGLNAFVDAGTAYDAGATLADQHLERGYGGGVWFSLTAFRLSVEVAHGIGAGTRVHVGGGLTF